MSTRNPKSNDVTLTSSQPNDAASSPPANPSPTPPPQASLAPPPADAKIPAPPPGTVAPGGGSYRPALPRLTELAAMSGATADLKQCDFNAIFPHSGLPAAQVQQGLEAALAWTTMRKQTAAWDRYCRTQEGITWTAVRQMIARLRPEFDLACVGDPSLASTFTGLATLFGARKAISRKGAAARKANKAANAKGQPQYHGGVGKKRQRAAERAALENAKAKESSPPPTVNGSHPPVTAGAGGEVATTS